MTTENVHVTVLREQYESFRQHCESCPNFHGELSGFPEGSVVVSSKRKAPHEPGPQRQSGPPKRLRHVDTSLRWFQRNSPNAVGWRKRQIDLGLNTPEEYQEVIRAFGSDRGLRIEKAPASGRSQNELINLAERLATLTRNSAHIAGLQTSVARFEALLLLSYCNVLTAKNFPHDTVDRIIAHITPRKSDRRRLLGSALWINDVINKLVSHGWSIHRATELFFLSMYYELLIRQSFLTSCLDALSPKYLYSIYYPENKEAISEYFKTDQFVGHDYDDCLGPNYTIPGLIASLVHAHNISADTLS